MILGVSLDSIESHRDFAEKLGGVPFPLLADPDGKLAGLYGVDTSGGYAKRTTFVIAPDGRIAAVWPKVKIDGHEAEVLEAVKKTISAN